MKHSAIIYWAGLASVFYLVFSIGCASVSDADTDETTPGEDSDAFQTTGDFVSADNSSRYGSHAANSAPGGVYDMSSDGDADGDSDGDMDADTDMDTDADGDGARMDDNAVLEGDIYRLLNTGTLLVLNRFRGLQVVDISNPASPTILGRLAIEGTPVEMYTSGTTAVILFNDHLDYALDDAAADMAQVFSPIYGAAVLTVDLTDVTHPRRVSQEMISGTIVTSRMVQGTQKQALYLAANGESNDTLVKSFGVGAGGELTSASELSLGLNVADITATTEALLVARTVNDGTDHSVVTLIDISDAAGQMVQGPDFVTEGVVAKKSDMSLEGDILRIVSGRSWTSDNSNHLQTWNVADYSAPVAVANEAFGESEDLYATLFMRDRAFFVTFRQTDPFHAFEIDGAGNATERTEYIISGWNNFFKAAFSGTRILGVGQGDTGLAVSLYDTSLETNDPFLQRVELDVTAFGSEAFFDDRAFTVIDNAVSVPAADGTMETGVVLLPYSRWTEWGAMPTGVQIITFSQSTLTVRGTMANADYVKRSFTIDDRTVANLSEEELNFYDFSTPNSPVSLGSVSLAPSYTAYFPVGPYALRINTSPEKYDEWADCYYDWNESDWAAQLPGAIEVVSASASPDSAPVLASVDISPFAHVFVKDALAVVVSPAGDCSKAGWIIDTIDFTAPLAPLHRGTLTAALPGYIHQSAASFYFDGCTGNACRHNRFLPNARLIGNALVIPDTDLHDKDMGEVRYCVAYPDEDPVELETAFGIERIYYEGGILCETDDDGEKFCDGEFLRCVERLVENGSGGISDFWEYDCESVDKDSIETENECWDEEKARYWHSYRFAIIDISDPSNILEGNTLSMEDEHEAVGLIAHGDELLISTKVPTDMDNDARGYVRYYVTTLNLENPRTAALGASVNVPGEVFAVAGATLLSKEPVWSDNRMDTALNTITIDGNAAIRTGMRTLEDVSIESVVADSSGRLFVTANQNVPPELGTMSDCMYYDNVVDDGRDYSGLGCVSNETNTLSIVDSTHPGMLTLGEIEIPSWASAQMAINNMALLEVPGGLMVLDARTPAQLVPGAFIATPGLNVTLHTVDNDLTVSAGHFGIHQFNSSLQNL